MQPLRLREYTYASACFISVRMKRKPALGCGLPACPERIPLMRMGPTKRDSSLPIYATFWRSIRAFQTLRDSIPPDFSSVILRLRTEVGSEVQPLKDWAHDPQKAKHAGVKTITQQNRQLKRWCRLSDTKDGLRWAPNVIGHGRPA